MHRLRLTRRTLLAATLAARPTAPRAEPDGQTIDLVIAAPAASASARTALAMAPAFAAYAKAQHGYTVDIRTETTPEASYYDSLVATLKAQSASPTLLVIDTEWLDALAAPKWILPLNPLIQANPTLEVDWFSPIVRSAFQLYPDHVANRWAIPLAPDILVLYVRKDLLTAPDEIDAFRRRYAAPLPQTWDDFDRLAWPDYLRVLDFFTRPETGLHGLASHFSPADDGLASAATSFIFGADGEIWRSKGGQVEGILDTDVNADALAAYKSLQAYQPEDAIHYATDHVTAAFRQKKVFSALQWNSEGPAMIPPLMLDDVLVVPPPAFVGPDGQKRRRYVLGGKSWAINAVADDAHRRVAADFLAWWVAPDTVLEFARNGGTPCDRITVSRDDIDTIQPWFRAYRATLPGAGQLWRDPSFHDLLDIQSKAFGAIMAGAPARATLGAAACRQQSILFGEGTAESQPGPSCQELRPGTPDPSLR